LEPVGIRARVAAGRARRLRWSFIVFLRGACEVNDQRDATTRGNHGARSRKGESLVGIIRRDQLLVG